MKWIRRDLGRYWVSGFYFFAGLIVFLKGYFGMRMEERSRVIQQQQPPHYTGNQP